MILIIIIILIILILLGPLVKQINMKMMDRPKSLTYLTINNGQPNFMKVTNITTLIVMDEIVNQVLYKRKGMIIMVPLNLNGHP